MRSPDQVTVAIADSKDRGSMERASSSRKRKPSVIVTWLRSIPPYAFIALAVLAVLETLSMVGVYYYVQGQANSSRDAALNIARVSGRAIERILDNQKAPIYEMSDYIKVKKGRYPDIAKEFYNLAAELAKNYQFYEIEMAPGGFTSDMYLPDNSNKYFCPFANLTGQDLIDWKVGNFDLYTDILWPDPVRPSYWGPLTADLATINQNASIFLIGPWVGNGILADGAFVSRMSIYLNNGGDWDFPLYLPNQTTQSTYCNFSFCTLPDNRTLWGFVNVVFPLDFITVGLAAVQSANLNYMLTSSYFQLGYPDPFLASNHNMTSSDNSVCTPIDVYNWLSWTLCVSQNGGWNPKWAPALYAGVTLLCLLISILVFFVLRSRAKAVEFLGKQVVWNKELETEKEKLQAMMVRQYELIECFTKKNQLSSGIEDKIKAARDQLTTSGVAQMAEQDKILLFNLLGQGSFGAVFLGEWRGTRVAVKRIILPPAMSMSSRAEKMAIMEVAISSSMSHPHLVQTYTYRVKPIEDKADPLMNSCIVVMGGGNGTTMMQSTMVEGASVVSGASSQDSSAVTSYELLLVLEYCDKGSLRSLLDSRGLFDENDRLNYPAVLDICLDIAKAMIHLHRNNIMHLDLKAANVLLKTGSTGENSLVAKVMDFGLSVSLDVETHVSSLIAGTTSHMSPEILMEGKQSMAADVYAFGITLWEVYTGNKAYKGIPQMVLGHKIVFEHLRPAFPADAPSDFRLLAEKCWQPDPKKRPTFDCVFEELREMRDAIRNETMPLRKLDASFQPAGSGMISQGPGPLEVARFAPEHEIENGDSVSNSIVANSLAAAYHYPYPNSGKNES